MRYIIGIDLGTTNSCVSVTDMQSPSLSIQPFLIPQLKAEGQIAFQHTLPSCCYLAAPHEWPEGALNLPWNVNLDYFVGSFALAQGAKVPTRLVQSAKSWLCHATAQRREKILPFGVGEEHPRISPVEASIRYLRHIKDAWNDSFAKGDRDQEFEQQEIVLTVPASFDEVARTLTVEAAKKAGFGQLTLLEEPQAAFYAWIAQHERDWQKILPAGSRVLVCDVGGGTTDFSLIEVYEQNEQKSFRRMAVGDHLLLGGDNMDAAIARHIESKLSSKGHPPFSPLQWVQLNYQARLAKEALLQANEGDSFRVFFQKGGSHVVAGTITEEVCQQEIHQIILGGFFQECSWEEAIPIRKSSGMGGMGLPYEEETSIPKQLAHFLNSNRNEQGVVQAPDFVLFNGGVLKPNILREALLRTLRAWFPHAKPQELKAANFDTAVSRGAVYYGKVRRGIGVRIGGGAARGYYLAMESSSEAGQPALSKALTLLPRGSEEGSFYEPEQAFTALSNTPVSFQLYTSHTRLHDCQGDLVEINPEEMLPLPPIVTILRFGKGSINEQSKEKIPVSLRVALTAVGTLELSLKSLKSAHQWALEFQLRSAGGAENSLAILDQKRQDLTFDSQFLEKARDSVREAYKQGSTAQVGRLMEHLERVLEIPKWEWPLSLMRGLWDELFALAPVRKASPEHEIRWWNLIGFLLRPGYGYPLDDHRVKELWKMVLADLKGSGSEELMIQKWICYRRFAGGLTRGQQMQLAAVVMPALLPKSSGQFDEQRKKNAYAYEEKLRLMASMELLERSMKIALGNALMHRMKAGQLSKAELWALGRIASRRLLKGGPSNVLPPSHCAEWIEKLLHLPVAAAQDELKAFVLGQMACKTDLRELDFSSDLHDRILASYAGTPYQERLRKFLQENVSLTQKEQELQFGENLPQGLSLAD